MEIVFVILIGLGVPVGIFFVSHLASLVDGGYRFKRKKNFVSATCHSSEDIPIIWEVHYKQGRKDKVGYVFSYDKKGAKPQAIIDGKEIISDPWRPNQDIKWLLTQVKLHKIKNAVKADKKAASRKNAPESKSKPKPKNKKPKPKPKIKK